MRTEMLLKAQTPLRTHTGAALPAALCAAFTPQLDEERFIRVGQKPTLEFRSLESSRTVQNRRRPESTWVRRSEVMLRNTTTLVVVSGEK